MTKYRSNLPQLNGANYLTDGGLETTLIFTEGLELSEFAAIELLKNERGREQLYKYYSTYATIARDQKVGFILESATWRASLEWGKKLGYSKEALVDMNHKAIELLQDLRTEYENKKSKMVISGCIGPRGDGYNPDYKISEEEAEWYHSMQIETFSETQADFVSAFTMNNIAEAIGLTRAAKSADIPVVISFTVETDGKLPSGHTLKEAIKKVDKETNNTPVYYMINCAHPSHFEGALASGEPWVQRIRGIRANASTKSHAELDEAEELDAGNPTELGFQYKKLINRFRHLNVLGGCCGTDYRHVEEIYKACFSKL
jgi:S-methylmethionine-dependent homocysteine/selenocysteine methylase